MNQSSRTRVPEGTYFFTVCLTDRSSTLLTDRAETLKAIIAEVRKSRGFTMDTYVILPDRVHAIWTMPQEEADYLSCWSMIRSMFEKSIPDGNGTIWQDRVKAFAIRSSADLERHRRNCRDAPVDAGLVTEPSDWPYASFHDAGQTRRAA
jgi:putative transposase